MPRDGSGIYTQPLPDVAPSTTIASTVYNAFVNDVEQDLNAARPIVAGGTGTNNATTALFNLAGAKAAQVVTNYDTHVFVPGTFYSEGTASGEPVGGEAYAGVAYIGEPLANPPTNANVVVEARSMTDNRLWIRRKTAGVWGAWTLDGDLSGVNAAIALKVAKAGDTMSGFLVLHADPDAAMKAATKQYVDTRVLKAGDTMTGNLVIDHPTSSSQLVLDKSATGGANTSTIIGRVDGLTRWQLQLGNGSTESGGNVGSRLLLSCYDDAGVFLNSPLTGLRETGLLSVVGNPTAALGIATKQYVDAADAQAVRKNYIINGAMMVSQQNAMVSGTTNNYYPVDQFYSNFSNGGVQSFAQVAVATPGGSPNRLRVACSTADAAVAASDYLVFIQNIEGLRAADLLLGTSSAKTITIAFGVKAPAGTYCLALRNSAANRNYVAEYVISGGEANTDVRKTVTIALDQTGTWLKDTGIGLQVLWCMMSGTTFHTTANAWQASGVFATSSQFNLMGTIGNVLELFDVSLTVGSTAPDFVVPDYQDELEKCMRYWQHLVWGMENVEASGLNRTSHIVTLPVVMRIAPARTRITTGSSSNIRASDPATYVTANALDPKSIFLSIECAAAGMASASGFVEGYSARL